MKIKHISRTLALLLALVMTLSLVSLPVSAEEETAKVAQWNVTLTDDLRANFYLTIPDGIKETAQVQVTVGNGTSVSYSPSALEVSDNYYIVRVNIAAAQMTDNINIVILADGTEVANSTYTVAQYADTVLKDSSMQKYHELVLHMLDYGAKAQLYFSYNKEDLANADHPLTTDPVTPSNVKKVAIDGSVAGISFRGATLLLQNKVGICFYFNAPNGIKNYTFTIGEQTYEATAKGTQYYVQVNGINPQNYDTALTLTVSDGTSSQTITYSPMHYIGSMLSKSTSSAELKALLSAMYGYHLAACEIANPSIPELTIDGVILADTYVASASKDTNYAEKTELNANNSSDYRPLLKFDLSNALKSETLAANKALATVRFTFGVSVGKDLLTDADYSIYGFLPGAGASDADFTAITWNTVKEGDHSKLYRYSGNENCVFLKKEVPAAEVADMVSVGQVDGKTYITYTLSYTAIEPFICTEAGDTYGYLIMGFDFQQTIRLASMENESYNAPAVMVVLGDVHFCVYDQEVAEEKYLASANCGEKATYYLSCTCGEHGEETFEYGEVIAHVYESISAESKLEAPTANTEVQISDLSITATCGVCKENIAITDGIVLENSLLAAGENTVTVKYGELSTTVTIAATEPSIVLTGAITDDTYVDSSNKDKDFTAKKTLNTNSSSFRTYLRFNVSEILANEQFQANQDNAEVQIVLTIAEGNIADSTTYTLKAYAPAAGVTDTDFSQINWNSVDNKEGAEGTCSQLHWSNGTVLSPNVSLDGGTITLTLDYSAISEYVDSSGNLLFAFGTNTSGLKVASMENTDYATPAFKVILNGGQ